MPGLSCTDRIEARSMSSTAETGPPRRRWVAMAACSMSGKRTSALALWGCSTTVRQRDLGDEGQRALRAHHEVEEDVDGVPVVDEGVERVAGGVLDPVLLPDAPGERLVGRDLVPQRGEPGEQRAAWGRAGGARGGIAGVDLGAVGQHEPHALHGLVAVLRRAAAHAGGVVGHDAADHAGVDRGRVGTDLSPERRQEGVGLGADDAGLEDDAPAAVLDRQPRQPPARTTRTESEMAWPERLVPAARKVTCTPEAGRRAPPGATPPRARRPSPRSSGRAGRSWRRSRRPASGRDRTSCDRAAGTRRPRPRTAGASRGASGGRLGRLVPWLPSAAATARACVAFACV